jgi:ABC-type amino acid transport substrate-binding protein
LALLLLALLSVLPLRQAVAQDFRAALIAPNTLTVGTSGSAPPFSMTGPTGALEGFDIDIATMLGQALGLRVSFVQLDFAGLLPGLAAGRFDIIASGVTRTPERLASTSFHLLSPYIVNGVAITRREGDTAITGWSTVCGRTMGAVRGGTFQRVAMATLPAGCVTQIREYPGATELFLDLRNRRIDFAVHDHLGPNYLRAAGRLPGVTVLDDILSTITQSIAVGARNRPLADAIDAQLETWRADGTLSRVVEKWFGVTIDWSRAR